MATAPYTFEPVAEDHLPLLRRWLAEPHIQTWWGDSEQALTTIADHMADEMVQLFIVSHHGAPLGFIQSWSPHAEENHPCRDQPEGTLGIDQFIGEPSLVNCGHGSAFVGTFVAELFEAGAPRVITDPNPRNARAIRAYEKAGFRALDYRRTISGDALLMSNDAGKL
jgi:aminoglycoside 6'-N-acetyltransferase